MENIVGEGFSPIVTQQIEVRQQTHGSGYNSDRSYEDLIMLNNNTAWCKLVSSTKIAGSTTNYPTISKIIQNAKAEGINLSDDNIAESFILFNGTATFDHVSSAYNGQQRSGIASSNSPFGNDSVYGVGGNEFGLRPMPGIQSARIQHKNRGSIRTAQVKIKAFNRTQFELIDILYLRVGFSVLLEWGNSIYKNNKGVLQSNVNNSLASKFLESSDYTTILNAIQSKRLSSCGNYDALFGKVTNFHWSFLADGSYDITVDLVSMGDVIESFKLATTNQLGTAVSSSNTTNAAPLGQVQERLNEIDKPNPKVVEARFKHPIGEILYGYVEKLDSVKFSSKYKIRNWTVNDSPLFEASIRNYHGVFAGDVGTPYNQDFIRLGALLEQIQESTFFKINNQPILKFETNPDNSLMGIVKLNGENSNNFESEATKIVMNQISYNPFICVTPSPPLSFNQNAPFFNSAGSFELFDRFDKRAFTGNIIVNESDLWKYQDFFQVKIGERWFGRIMNIFVNFDFILDKLDQLRDTATGTVNLIDFLRELLDGISGALGGINQLDIHVDETTNIAKIFDKNPYPDATDILLKKTGSQISTGRFSLYGYTNDGKESNFVRDFKFTTELTPEYSTMITVAATSNGEAVGSEYTALSRINNGLYDRYKKNLEIPTPFLPKDFTENKDYYGKSIYRFQYLTTAFGLTGTPPRFRVGVFDFNLSYRTGTAQVVSVLTYLDSLYGFPKSNNKPADGRNYWNPSTINSFQYTAGEMFKSYFRWVNNFRYMPLTSGFIPFNLSLTIDGLSGMKIYQKFEVESNFMPSNYPNTLEFIIKNISHEISNNKWITTIESICSSKPGGSSEPIEIPVFNETGLGKKSTDTEGTGGVTTTISGSWRVENGGRQITSGYELRLHHVYSVFEPDPANTRSGGWSKSAGGQYLYDMVLSRNEGGRITYTPEVPSAVSGKVTYINFKGDTLDYNSFIQITGDDGKKYQYFHVNRILVTLGQQVTKGQSIAHQYKIMPTTLGIAPNIHLHIQFPTKQSVIDYISNLVNGTF